MLFVLQTRIIQNDFTSLKELTWESHKQIFRFQFQKSEQVSSKVFFITW